MGGDRPSAFVVVPESRIPSPESRSSVLLGIPAAPAASTLHPLPHCRDVLVESGLLIRREDVPEVRGLFLHEFTHLGAAVGHLSPQLLHLWLV